MYMGTKARLTRDIKDKDLQEGDLLTEDKGQSVEIFIVVASKDIRGMMVQDLDMEIMIDHEPRPSQ